MSISRFTILCFIFLLKLNVLFAQEVVAVNADITVHRLDAAEYKTLKGLLSKYGAAPLKDTIIIKYDFNNDNCWDSLEKRSGVFIHTIIGAHRNEINALILGRPGISVFQLKEKGKEFSKFKKWNADITTDRNNGIGEILFKKNTKCGSSAIVLPGGIFLLVSSDEHFNALKIGQQQIAGLLKP